jgi:molybdopterin molybdotransferase
LLPRPGQIRDINSYVLSALVSQGGGDPVNYGVIPDDLQKINDIARTALLNCDCVVITAGSSASTRDMTAQVINALGQPGVLVHGINIRPGKPTILGVCNNKAVIGLPGNPVSAFIIARLILLPLMEKLLGLKPKPKPSVYANLTINIPSQAGREDWVAVKLRMRPSLKSEMPRTGVHMDEQWLAEPVFGKSNFIYSLANADGVFCIPPDITGFNAGERVEVSLI